MSLDVIDTDRLLNAPEVVDALVSGAKVYFEPVSVIDYVLEYGGVEFHVHRMPLISRSKYFEIALAEKYEGTPLALTTAPIPVFDRHTSSMDVPDVFGQPVAKISYCSIPQPRTMLMMLAHLYSALAPALMSQTLPVVRVQLNGTLLTTGIIRVGWYSLLRCPKVLDVGLLQLHSQWDCSPSVRWDSYALSQSHQLVSPLLLLHNLRKLELLKAPETEVARQADCLIERLFNPDDSEDIWKRFPYVSPCLVSAQTALLYGSRLLHKYTFSLQKKTRKRKLLTLEDEEAVWRRRP